MKVFVTLPTYNERDNIAALIEEIRSVQSGIYIVVADNDSPDGTWKIVENIARNDSGIFLLRRTENKGRGSAGIDAFRFALDHGADVVIEMDADFSHYPKYIPVFLEEIRQYDLVLGSRFVDGGRDLRNSFIRNGLSTLSALYARTVLGLPVKDCNSGYRCFRRDVLTGVDVASLRSTGPSIVQELLYKAYLKGFSIKEIPIDFSERKAGVSNLNFKRLLRGFLMVLEMKSLHMAGKL